MRTLPVAVHEGRPEDAETISALAIQVFLDTYATDGVRPDLAAEAFEHYGPEAIRRAIDEPGRVFLLARRGPGLLGFAEFRLGPVAIPGQPGEGAELVRLYVQPRFQRLGVGKELLAEVEKRVRTAGGNRLWFTVWEENEWALVFYSSNGYREVGTTTYEFQGRAYGNKVLTKALGAAGGAAA